MKLRLNQELHERATMCAKAMDEDLKYFLCSAMGFLRKGKLDSVAVDMNLTSATRGYSTPITFEEVSFPSDEARIALAKAVIFAEARRIPQFVPIPEERKFYTEESE